MKANDIFVNNPLSLGEILIDFFKFYSLEYDTDSNAIDISMELGHSICSRNDIRQWVFKNTGPINDLYKSQAVYLILDPFNRTYNPAKGVKDCKIYPGAFANKFDELLFK